MRELVEAKAVVLAGGEAMEAARKLRSAEPESLLTPLLRHVRTMFECRSLEGFIPLMTSVYLEHQELMNFSRALVSVRVVTEILRRQSDLLRA